MVQEHPRSGLLQGAEPYLRWRAGHKDTDPDIAAALGAVLAECAGQRSGAATGLTAAV
ncbi:hypothetical protein ABZX75_33280 [Streptomyces sp. NPDC003038]|uniref:hypothetical protein n=1 Tax=unclassified Streptomyces TaxID=2593676 RepID=UPI0033A9B842